MAKKPDEGLNTKILEYNYSFVKDPRFRARIFYAYLKVQIMKIFFPVLILILFSFSCQTSSENTSGTDTGSASVEAGANPAAAGFNVANSDQKAIDIADEVMEAMGGRKSWDETRYLVWNFFGRRKLFWDKHTGKVRIESLPDSTIYLVNVFDNSGKVKRGDQIMENPDSLTLYSKKGKSIWINDAYWLVMPFKLKDSGVTLKYIGVDTTQAGAKADVLQLTFEGVGDTPDNKYHVYVDQETKLVSQWDFYGNFQDEAPRFSTPWEDYQSYGPIKLSGSRGKGKLTEIGRYADIPEMVFTDFTVVNAQNFQ